VALLLSLLLSVAINAPLAGAAFACTTTVPSEAIIFNAQISTEYPRVLYQIDGSNLHAYISASGDSMRDIEQPKEAMSCV
jgi:hypothetical protein